MGTWGPGISSNDTFSDIYSQFIDFYDQGFDCADITDKIIRNNQDLIEDVSEAHNFWFALGKAQWECQSLNPLLFEKLQNIVETGENIAVWIRLGVDEETLKKRQRVLDAFIAKIALRKSTKRKRKTFRLYDGVFERGDCLVFRLNNGNFGGAVVLASEKQTKYGFNLIATTAINQKNRPTIDDFLQAELLVVREKSVLKSGFHDREKISWYYASFFSRSGVDFEVVGRLKVYKKYSVGTMSVFSDWAMIPAEIEKSKELVEKYGMPEKSRFLKEFLGVFWWPW